MNWTNVIIGLLAGFLLAEYNYVEWLGFNGLSTTQEALIVGLSLAAGVALVLTSWHLSKYFINLLAEVIAP